MAQQGIIVDPKGNVGIGTTLINAPLVVRTNNSNTGVVINQTGTGPVMDIQDGGVSRLFIDTEGNIGIGTTFPQAKLQINGPVQGVYNFTSSDVNIYGIGISPSNVGITNMNATLNVQSKDPYARNKGGAIGLGGRSYAWGGSEFAMLFARISGVQSTYTENYYGNFVIETHNQGTMYERMRIDGYGSVGIGTDNPQKKLHVHSTDGNSPIFCTGSSAGSVAAKTFLTGKGAGAILMPCVGNTDYIYIMFNDANGTPRQLYFNGAAVGGGGALFTGQHINFSNVHSFIDSKEHEGLIIVSSGYYQSYNTSSNLILPNNMQLNECLPIIELSSKPKQKSVFGVITNYPNVFVCRDDGSIVYDYEDYDFERDIKGRIRVNSLGEGGIWICNANGNLENGDYITSSIIPGYGMKQDESTMMNYTVGKITCDCDFDNLPEWIKTRTITHNNIEYKCAFVGCTYHCG